MNKMIKMATIVAGVGAMLSFAGCGNGNGEAANTNSPEGVALQQIKALAAQTLAGSENCTYKVEKSEIKDGTGIVYVGIYENNKKVHEEKVDVKKVNDNWIAKP